MSRKLVAVAFGLLIWLAPALPASAASLLLSPGATAPGLGSAPLPAGTLRQGHALADGPVVVGNARRLSDLVDLAGAGSPEEDAHGLASVALGAVNSLSGLSSLTPASRGLVFSADLDSGNAPTLYSRVVGVAENYQLSRVPGAPRLVGTSPLGGASLTGQFVPAGGPRLFVPDLQLASGEARSSYLAELGGIRLSGRLSQLDDHDSQAYDLVASLPLASPNVGVSAHYHLVDVDRLAGDPTLKAPTRQTVGVGGEVALTGGTVLKAGYEVTRDGAVLTGTRTDADLSLKLNPRTDVSAGVRLDRDLSAGPQVRTSLGVGYQLSGDAALRASYTLINFGAEAQKSQDKRLASAELSLRF